MAEPAAAAPPSKPRVLLSILKCNCFEHLEGEQLFTAITAGFGRFDCDRLLKPSGVELMNLPSSANIEVSVLRRERDRQKQLLYHGLVALSALQPVFAQPEVAPGEPQPPPPSWESWLGLFSSDVSLKAQAPERVFQRCLEMGSSGARFPRLLLRLQYLPPGHTAASTQAERKNTSQGVPSQSPLGGSLTLEHGRPTGGGSTVAHMKSLPPEDPLLAQSPAPEASPVKQSSQHPREQLDTVREQMKQMERRAALSQEREASREETLRVFFEQAGPSLSRLGRPPKLTAKEAAGSLEASRAQLLEVVTVLSTAERPARNRSKESNLSDDAPTRMGFYKPVKTDPIDCLLAATFLRLDAEPPAIASELSRIEAGLYRIGNGMRLKCHVSSGRIVAQAVGAVEGVPDSPTELFALLRSLPAAAGKGD